MNLHARNVAIQAGVPEDLILDTVDFMKVRNKISVQTAQTYLRSHEVFTQIQERAASKKSLSSFFVEVREDFLPEPLILTVLLDSISKQAVHLSIEKNMKNSAVASELCSLLFGGNKGYAWLTSFLGLLHSISFVRTSPTKQPLLMTSYRLKLLTVLTNLLITNLLKLQGELGSKIVQELILYLKKQSEGNAYMNIKSLVPSSNGSNQAKDLVIPYGLSLLIELVFSFVVYCNEELDSVLLR